MSRRTSATYASSLIRRNMQHEFKHITQICSRCNARAHLNDVCWFDTEPALSTQLPIIIFTRPASNGSREGAFAGQRHCEPNSVFRPTGQDVMDARRTRVAPALYWTVLHRTKADHQVSSSAHRTELVSLSERGRTVRRLAGNYRS